MAPARLAVEVRDVRVNDSDSGIDEPGHSMLEIALFQAVIGIQETEDVGGCGEKPGKTRPLRVAMVDSQILHVLISKRRDDLLRVVGRRIIDHYDFSRANGL